MCDGPDVSYFWDNPVMQLPTVLSTFVRMVQCLGIRHQGFDSLKTVIRQTGERDSDGHWRSKK